MMNVITRLFLQLIGIVTLLSGCSKLDRCCDELIAQAARPEVRNTLEAWVDENTHFSLLTDKVKPAAGGGPGDYWFIHSFPWGDIGLDPKSPDNQIRLICDEQDRPEAFFFGEGGRCGYIVSIDQEYPEDFLYKDMLLSRYGRVAVFCDEKMNHASQPKHGEDQRAKEE